MKRLLLKIQPLTAFGSKINGGMLFGQFCCTIKMLCGEERLQSLLDGYCDNKPFAVFSDAMPQGLVPMPTLPFTMWVPTESSAAERKRWKKMRWLARAALDYSPDRWHEFAQPHSETDVTRAAVAHNTIRRDTMTTGTDQFAPFQKEASFYEPNSVLDIHIVLDEKRLSQEELLTIMRVLGQIGFGADASAGLGKFDVLSVEEERTVDTPCRRYVALSACAPQGTGLRAANSFFRSQTYFGRHGAERVYGPSPFKRPILMAAPGAVFDCGEAVSLSWIGKGISGHSVYADTVHQGYGVVLPIAHWFKETSHAK